MRLNYFQKIVFSMLEIVAGVLNLLSSLIGRNPTCDLDGRYLSRKMEDIQSSRVRSVSKQRVDAENEYRERVREINIQ